MATEFAKTVEAGEVRSAKKLDHGGSGAILITYHNGLRGVVKRRVLSSAKTRGVPYAEQYLREVLAYKIDNEVFRFGIVPETLTATYDGKVSSVQEFVEGETAPDIVPGVFDYKAADWKMKVAKFFCRVDPEVIKKVVLFDLAVNNTDRHGRNLIFTKGKDGLYGSGKIWAIDNEGTFGQWLACYRNVFHKYMFLTNFALPDLAESVLEKITKEQLEATIRPVIDKPELVDQTYARIQWVLKHKDSLGYYSVSKGQISRDDFPSWEAELKKLANNEPLNVKIFLKQPKKGVFQTQKATR